MSAPPRGRASGMTPQQRLAASRRAIVQSMLRDSGGQDGESPEGADDDAAVSGRPSPRQGPFDEAFAQATSGNRHGDLQGAKRLWRRLRRTAAAWWRTHPAHLALEVVQPMVGRYAQAHPVKLLTVGPAVSMLTP